MNNKLLAVILALGELALAFLIDYFCLPSYNPGAFSTWVLAALYLSLFILNVGIFMNSGKVTGWGPAAGGILFLAAVILSAGSWVVFPGNDHRYASLMAAEDKDLADFSAKFAGSDARQTQENYLILPTIDKELSIKLAQSRLGIYGAQFSMNEDVFTAITVMRNGELQVVRNSPLDYSGAFVALANRGSVGYLQVDQVSADARLVEVPGKMMYSPNAVFSRDLKRLVRSRYKTALLGSASFEIDDEGHPYWLYPVIRRTIGLFGGDKADGLILVDPVTGETSRYALGEEPSWIDRAIPTEIVLDQSHSMLSLKNGWFNKFFGQKREVFQLSDGYNYAFSGTPSGGQTWLVSGVTSPSEADQTLVGFMMINMKTQKALRYPISGITEMRAMEIAENDERVRAQTLTATWPILTSVGGEPVFYLFLKNQVQRQRFVYIDAFTGQNVAMGETRDAAAIDFARLSGLQAEGTLPGETVSGTVLRIRLDSTAQTVEFLLKGDSVYRYSVEQNKSNDSRFLQAGDNVELTYRESSAGDGTRFVMELKNRTLGE